MMRTTCRLKPVTRSITQRLQKTCELRTKRGINDPRNRTIRTNHGAAARIDPGDSSLDRCHRGNRNWIAVAAPAGQAQFIFITIAFCCLGYSFITNDFSVLNVATNSNSQLPLHYRLAATWGSHEGSLLLWTLMLALWTVAVSLFSGHLPKKWSRAC